MAPTVAFLLQRAFVPRSRLVYLNMYAADSLGSVDLVVTE